MALDRGFEAPGGSGPVQCGQRLSVRAQDVEQMAVHLPANGVLPGLREGKEDFPVEGAVDFGQRSYGCLAEDGHVGDGECLQLGEETFQVCNGGWVVGMQPVQTLGVTGWKAVGRGKRYGD